MNNQTTLTTRRYSVEIQHDGFPESPLEHTGIRIERRHRVDVEGGDWILDKFEHSGTHFSRTGTVTYPYNGWDTSKAAYVLKLGNMADKLGEVSVDAILEEYNQYLNGEVYGFIIKDLDTGEEDGCWGHFGFKHAKDATLEALQNFTGNHALTLDAIPDEVDEKRTLKLSATVQTPADAARAAIPENHTEPTRAFLRQAVALSAPWTAQNLRLLSDTLKTMSVAALEHSE